MASYMLARLMRDYQARQTTTPTPIRMVEVTYDRDTPDFRQSFANNNIIEQRKNCNVIHTLVLMTVFLHCCCLIREKLIAPTTALILVKNIPRSCKYPL